MTDAELTLEEKAGLLVGRDWWSTRPVDSVGLPSVVLSDGPHGLRRQEGRADHLGLNGSEPATCFPPAVAVGNSWDPDVAEGIGAAIAVEARSLGVHIALGPGINIKRSPLCGRNFEYYSEDPLLSGVLGAAHVRGQQNGGVGASVKHFAANNQETDRMRVSAEVDERTLREIYLPAFERVVTEAEPASVMCSYNKLNGIHTAQHPWLLTDLLRGEWGFRGAVVSDWGAVQDRVASLVAGLDLEMPGPAGTSVQQLVDAVRAGELDESVVDAAVDRVVALAALVTDRTAGFDVDAHHTLAADLAAGCAVLLKNDGEVLPLDGAGPIAVVGPFASTPRYQGGGSSHVNATRVDVPLDALRALAEERGRTVRSAPGCSLDGSGDAAALREEAVDAARAADVTIVFAGLAEDDESEGFDRSEIGVPRTQIDLIRAVAAVSRRTVVVLAHGGVLSLEDWYDEVDAVLDGFLLGQGGGSAIAQLLFGLQNPSGRLAESVPLRLEDNPSFVNFPGEKGYVRYGEGVMVGYRWYGTTGTPVRHPFGYGLSYTTFRTGDLAVELTGPDTVRASVTVANSGRRAGSHVVQLYVATTAGDVRRPVRELRAFRKIRLEPGEERTVTVDLDRRSFAYWDVDRSDWAVAPGTYAIQVGQDAGTVLEEVAVELAGDAFVPALELDSTVGEWFAHPIVGPTLFADLTAGMPAQLRDSLPSRDELLRIAESMPMRKVMEMLGDAVPSETVDRLMAASRG